MSSMEYTFGVGVENRSLEPMREDGGTEVFFLITEATGTLTKIFAFGTLDWGRLDLRVRGFMDCDAMKRETAERDETDELDSSIVKFGSDSSTIECSRLEASASEPP